MALNNRDEETIRGYLLGKLTDDEEVNVEQRLLTEDGFFEDMEVAKDELVEEYQAKQLKKEEGEWFERNFLASPEGKQSQAFAKALNRYVVDHRLPSRQNRSLVQGLVAFWNSQPDLLRVAAAVAVVAIVAGIVWISRAPSPQNFATLTLLNTASTRSSGIEPSTVRLKEDALRLTLMLPASATPGVRYRVDVINDKDETKSYEAAGQNAQSVSLEIPAAQLPPGHYLVTVSTVSDSHDVQRIPGSYRFTVE
ncbi:MAG TPA: hypothetical protein VEW46_14815 [Pyrinomonadaceae bacterium]|nr:hypothetical protein [Pyrinomonadaceae bacterium]